jgi:poly(A) polymerase
MTDFPISPLARQIFDIAAAINSEARIVGGAVRDWAAGLAAGDVDMAIAAPIEDAAAAFRARGLKVVDTGLSHGTVTVVGDGEVIEVTQTRIDVDTDGRHAVVAFSDDWSGDAARRDFTINAIYIDANGAIFDPLDGRADLAAGILRFAGDPVVRLQEDALRMLRFCRFVPRFASAGTDAAALDALQVQAPNLARLSGERVAGECRKLFGAPNAFAGVSVMQDCDLAKPALGVDLIASRLHHFPAFDLLGSGLGGDAAMLWLVTLAGCTDAGSAKILSDRLRLSRRESRFLKQLDSSGSRISEDNLSGEKLSGPDWRRTAWFIEKDEANPAALYAVSCARAERCVDPARYDEIARWSPPECPVSATDLLSQGVDKGPALGEMLRAAEHLWVANDFSLTKDQLLAKL